MDRSYETPIRPPRLGIEADTIDSICGLRLQANQLALLQKFGLMWVSPPKPRSVFNIPLFTGWEQVRRPPPPPPPPLFINKCSNLHGRTCQHFSRQLSRLGPFAPTMGDMKSCMRVTTNLQLPIGSELMGRFEKEASSWSINAELARHNSLKTLAVQPRPGL